MNIKEFKVGEKAWVYYDHRGTEVLTEVEVISVGRKIVKVHNEYGIETSFKSPLNRKNSFWLEGEAHGYIDALLFKNQYEIPIYKEAKKLENEIYRLSSSSTLKQLSYEELKTIKSIFDKYN